MEDAAPLPPPPPPPPPPADEPKRPQPNHPQKPKRKKDFREILTLFHEESTDAARTERVWSQLWQTTLVEAQDDHKRRRQQEQHGVKRKSDHGLTPSRLSALRHGGPDHLKRARQSSTASTDSSESGKRNMGGRFAKNVAPKAKFLHKLGPRGT